MDAAELVFDIGDSVVGWGEIWDDPDGVWFDPPHTIDLSFGGPKRRSTWAVLLEGCEPDMIATDRSRGGQGPGWATVEGVWLGASIRFVAMTPASHPEHDGEPPQRVDPPCPAPPGGWPAGTQADLQGFDSRAVLADHVVEKTRFLPRPDSVVLAITTTDVQAVENELRYVLGDRLCVVHSRWGRPQLEAVREHLRAHWRIWELIHFYKDTDDRAQSVVNVGVLRVSPEMAEWATGLPAGIVVFAPALRPAAVAP